MKKSEMLFLIIGLFLSSLISTAQSTWEYTYGGTEADQTQDFIGTNDSGSAVVGSTNSYGTGGDILLTKINKDGGVQWSKNYGTNGNDVAYSIFQTADSGYVLAGYSDFFSGGKKDVYVLKLDKSGIIQWTKYFGDDNLTGDMFKEDEEAFTIIQTSEGGYILGGHSDHKAMVVKLNSVGNITWAKKYFICEHLLHQEVRGIRQLPDNNYVLIGRMGEVGNPCFLLYSFLMKMDINGAILKQKRLLQGHPWDITLTPDNGILFTGSAGGWVGGIGLGVCKVDSAFNSVFACAYGYSSGTFGGVVRAKVALTKDSGFVATGFCSYEYPQLKSAYYIVKADKKGNFEWNRIISGENNEDPKGICVTPDKGIVVGGYTESYGAGNGDFHLVKLDSLGNTTGACPGYSIPQTERCDYVDIINWPDQINKVPWVMTGEGSGGAAFNAPLTETPVSCNQLFISDFTFNTACLGDSAAFTDFSTGYIPSQWDWNFGDDASGPDSVSTLKNPKHKFTTIGFHSVTLVVNDGIKTDTIVKDVEVFPSPDMRLVYDSTACLGDTITINGNCNYAYQWLPSHGLISTTGCYAYASPSVSMTYTFVATSDFGCTDSSTFHIHMDTPTKVALSTSPSITICKGQSTILTVSGATEYEWFPMTALNINSSGASVTASPTTTKTYSVTSTGVSDCVYSDTVSIVVIVIPSTLSVGPDITICIGSQGKVLTVSGGSQYDWTPLEGLSSSTGSVVSANPTATTTYSISSTMGSCKAYGDILVTVDDYNLGTGSSTTICIGDSIILNAYGGVQYSWSPQTAISNPNISGPIVNPTTSVSYTVVAQNAANCIANAIYPVIVKDCFSSDTLLFIPNIFTPTGDGQNDLFKLKGNGIKSFNIKIYNRWGAIVFESDNILDSWNGNNGSSDEMSEGTYYYLVKYQFANSLVEFTRSGTVSLIH